MKTNATEQRVYYAGTEEIAKKVDLMIVIGRGLYSKCFC